MRLRRECLNNFPNQTAATDPPHPFFLTPILAHVPRVKMRPALDCGSPCISFGRATSRGRASDHLDL